MIFSGSGSGFDTFWIDETSIKNYFSRSTSKVSNNSLLFSKINKEHQAKLSC